jgi:hypothetical protein
MRDGLLTLGVILLVLGAIFSFVPEPQNVNAPNQPAYTYALALWSMLCGALCIVLGLVLPGSDPFVSCPEQALVHHAPPEPAEAPARRPKIKIRKQSRRH